MICEFCNEALAVLSKVADAIAAGFHIPVVELDLTKDDPSAAIDETDILLAALPVYAGRVPQVALKRLSAIRGNGQKTLAVVVYGNREYDDALPEKECLHRLWFLPVEPGTDRPIRCRLQHLEPV